MFEIAGVLAKRNRFFAKKRFDQKNGALETNWNFAAGNYLKKLKVYGNIHLFPYTLCHLSKTNLLHSTLQNGVFQIINCNSRC